MDKFNIFSWFKDRAKIQEARAKAIEELLVKFPPNAVVRKNRRRKEQRRRQVQMIVPSYWNEVNYKVFDNAHGFALALMKKGFKKLGGGAHGSVYVKENSKRVIKVLSHPGDGWIDYIRWASEKGYAGSFAPKVYSYKYIKGKIHDFALASMERMDKTLRDVKCSHQMAFMNGLFNYAVAHDNDNAKKLLDFAVPGMANFSDQLKVRFKQGWDFHDGNFMVRADGTLAVVDPVAGIDTNNVQERFRASA